ncbi:DEAD/DEAH box helicase [Rickettsiales bacterium]|nr:DEAD/DEAH box helicase [Rickettsiales bacterium]
MTDFKKLNLSTKIISSLDAKGYTHPTPIQKESIPHLLKGRDLLGIAQTGTGKTAAFSLPILDNLTKSANKVRSNGVRSLILTPTRELASQIANNIDRYGSGLGLKHKVIFGGVNIKNQISDMRQGFDILIATPGRLLDLMSQGQIRYAQLEIFVLDEADRMLDMGFIRDVKKIISKLPPKRQTLLFSATMPNSISTLADSILDNPIKVEVTPASSTVEKIDQRVNLVQKSNKLLLLKEVLKQKDAKSVLVFSKTKHGANKIVKYLEEKSIAAAAIHGNKGQSAREKALDDFRKGKNKVLVATDIAARGIDVPDITHVINFDIPQDPESYVHRIGRTARAGRSGIAISFCDPSEKQLLKSVEKVIKFQIPVDDSHKFHGIKSITPLKNEATIKEGKIHNNRSKSDRSSSSQRNFNGRSNSDHRGRLDKDSQRDSNPKSNSFTRRKSKSSEENSQRSRFSRKNNLQIDDDKNRDSKEGYSSNRGRKLGSDSSKGLRNNSNQEKTKRSFFGRKNQDSNDSSSRTSNKNSRSQYSDRSEKRSDDQGQKKTSFGSNKTYGASSNRSKKPFLAKSKDKKFGLNKYNKSKK